MAHPEENKLEYEWNHIILLLSILNAFSGAY